MLLFYINTHVHVLTSTQELLGVTCINKVLYCVVIIVPLNGLDEYGDCFECGDSFT